MKLCIASACERPSKARGYCTLHYQRLKRCGDAMLASLTRHGDCASDEYRIWESMRGRCNNKNADNFERYGGRGIKVCKRWDDYRLFLGDMGRRPSSAYTIERIKNHLGYSPENCKWATRKEQQNNTRVNRLTNLHDKTMTVAQAARILRVSYMKMWHHVNNGGSAENYHG